MKKLHFILLLTSTLCFSQSVDYNNLDQLLESLSYNKKLMGSLTILKGGTQNYSKSVGYQFINSNNSSNASSESKYRIGSVTKTFTAVMIFQLLDEKKIKLTNKLSDYYPEIPNASKIKISNLLNHSSGLFNITNSENFKDWFLEPSTQEEMLSRLVKYEVDFQPGEKTIYSNTNYILLGYILEQIENKSYRTILKERIVDKLGLKSTYFGSAIDINNNECLSYIYEEDNNKLKEAPQTHMSNPGGAGGIVSTPLDLALFITALFNNKLISKESLKYMTKVSYEEFCSGIFYANMEGQDIYASEGGIDHFQSLLFYIPETKTAIVLCTNALNYSKMEIMLDALAVSHGKDIDLPNFNNIELNKSK
jgi:CubicO group peptidase (beta-lactamase class C family)